MQDFKAILFDFDGTLVHSVDLLVEIFGECLVEQGLAPAKPETIRRLIGEPLETIFRQLTNLVDVEKFNHSFHVKENLRHTPRHIRLVEKTIPTLKLLKKHGFLLGIVSTKQRELIEPLSRELDIQSYFDIIIGGKDVTKHKPHPEPIWLACERLDLRPRQVLFVGDSLIDLHAAKNAGCTFAGVLTGVASQKDFRQNQADYILEHLNQIIRLANILKRS